MRYYKLGDVLNGNERKQLKIPLNAIMIYRDTKAIKTEVFREPKKGEWFLSGAIPTAYRAPNDLSHKYHIAQLVKIKKKITYSHTF